MPRATTNLRRWWNLVAMLAWRDIQIKYKQSLMGFLWAVLMPAMVVGAGVLVQYAMSSYAGRPVDRQNLASIAVKAAPWAFVVSSVRFATLSLVSNATLITKIYLPREVFPVSAVLAQFADFCVASLAMALVLAIAGVGVSVALLWIPVLVVGLILLCLGLGMFLSAGALFYRDVKYLVDVVLTFAIFVTPVFFPITAFGRYARIILLNPVSPLLIGLSDVLVAHRSPSAAWTAYSMGVGTALCLAALVVFRRLSPLFAERV